jgi:hypothetical protein
VEELIPPEFYPRWQTGPAVKEDFVKIGPNGRPVRPVLTTEERLKKDFLERLSELETDNDAAFRVLNKRNLPGVRPPRIATMRKFWAQLENLSHYWDTSLDDYFRIPIVEHDAESVKASIEVDDEADTSSAKSPKRQRLDNSEDVLLTGTATTTDGRDDSADDVVDTVMTDDEPSQAEDTRNGTSTSTDEAHSAPREKPRYKGRRIGTGRDMPDRFRTDALLAFVEGCAWPFNSTVIPPRKIPVVRFVNLNIPIKQLACVYRLPNDGARRRAGWIQGPVIGLQGRAEIEFSGEQSEDVPKQDETLGSSVEQATPQDGNNAKSGSPTNVSADEKMDIDIPDQDAAINTPTDGFRKPSIPSASQNSTPRASRKKPPPVVDPDDRARLDVLREIGLLLEVAQERYREGKTEDKPGVGKWWTEKPRFGGGTGGSGGGDDKVADKSTSSSPEKDTAAAPSVESSTARPTRPSLSTTKLSDATSRQAATNSPTTLDFSSLRKAGSTTTTINGLGKSPSPNTTTTDDAPTVLTDKTNNTPPTTTASSNKPPIHPPMPTSTSKPKSSSIDPMLAAAATPTAAFANEIFSRYNRKEKKSPAAMWEILRPPTPHWDAKTEYRAIGKEKGITSHPSNAPPVEFAGDDDGGGGGGGGGGGSTQGVTKGDGVQESGAEKKASSEGMMKNREEEENEEERKDHDDEAGTWDDVFIVSSLNHHISLLRLTVHDKYLEFLLSGTLPPSSFPPSHTNPPQEPSEENQGEKGGREERGHWSIPLLRRSEWFDLLDTKSRCEAFRALWGVMAWLNRGEEIW